MSDRNLTRRELEASSRNIAGGMDRALTERHGKRVGFVLMLFDFGAQGTLAYISNAERDGMIGAVKEWLARQEAGLATDPPGPKLEA